MTAADGRPMMDEDALAREHFAQVMNDFHAQMADIGRMQQLRATLVATGYAADKRVAVSLNADGIVIETVFADDIGDLDHDEIAAAVTAAGQAAARDLQRQTDEVHAPLLERRARMPKLSEIIGTIEGLEDFPAPPAVSLAPPGSPDRVAADEDRPAPLAPQSGVKDSLW
ncbi:MAG: YbaB/EbfC family DNA-binding protein [Mycobacteriaceae bacterium]|nr:YbaB/EbfC family DNA-binding protein [Mycobacteriaceae bacterium]